MTRRYLTTRSRIFVSAAFTGAVVLGFASLAIPASAVASDQSEAEGRVLSGGGTVNLDNIAELAPAYNANPSDPGTTDNPLSVTAVNALNLTIGGGVQLLGPNGVINVGALGQHSSDGADGVASASSGAINGDGSIAVGSAGTTTNGFVDATRLLDNAGVSQATRDLISQLRVELGAISASATQQPGADPTSDYQIAGGRLVVTSPVLTTLTTNLNTALGTASTNLNAITGPTGTVGSALDGLATDVVTPLADSLSAIPLVGGAVTVSNVSITSTGVTADLQAALSAITTAPLVSTDGATTIDLSTGTITVDLAELSGNTDHTLNNLDPNTELLSGTVLQNAFKSSVNSALNQIPALLVTSVNNAINNATLTLNLTANASTALPITGTPVPLANISVAISGTLGGFTGATGSTPPTVDASKTTALGVLPIGALLTPIVNAVTDSLLPGLVTPIEDGITGVGIGDGVLQPIVTDATNALAPLLPTVDGIVSITANVQETPGSFTVAGASSANSFTERALQVRLLPVLGTPLATVNLASATVRSSALVITPVAITSPTAGTTYTVTGTGDTQSVTVSGTGQTGGAISVALTGGQTQTTTVANGTWTVTFPAVPVGDYTATATQTVGANVSNDSTTFSVEVGAATTTTGTTTAGTTTAGTTTPGTTTPGTTTPGTTTPGTTTPGTTTAGTTTPGTTTPGTTTAGTTTPGTTTPGTTTAGTTTPGTTTAGTTTDGTTTPGTTTAGTTTPGTTTPGTTTAGTTTAGTTTAGTTTAGTTTAGTTTPGTTTPGTTTAGTTTAGTTTAGTTTPGTTTPGTTTAGTTTPGTTTPGTTTAGTTTAGTTTPGTTTAGTTTPGTTTPGTTTAGTTTAGTTTAGTTTPGTTTAGTTTAGTTTAGTTTAGTTTPGTTTAGTTTAGTTTAGTTTPGTTTPGTTTAGTTTAGTTTPGIVTPVAITTPNAGTVYTVPTSTDTQSVTVSGTGNDGGAIRVTLTGGQTVTTTVVGGVWSVTFPAVPTGNYTAIATQTVGTSISTDRTTFSVTPSATTTTTGTTTPGTTTPGTTTPGTTTPGTTTPGTTTAGTTTPGTTTAGTTTTGTTTAGTTTQGCPVVPDSAIVTFGKVTQAGQAMSIVRPVGITLPADGTVHLVPSPKGGYDIVVRGDGAKGAVVSVNVNGVVKTAEVVGSGVYTVVFDNLLIGHYTVVVTQDFGGSVTTASTMFDVVLAGCGTSGTTTTGTTTAGTTTTGTTTTGTTTTGTTTAGTTTAGTTTAGTTTAGTTTAGTTTAGTTTAGTTTAGTTTAGTTTAGTTTSGTTTPGTTTAGTTTAGTTTAGTTTQGCPVVAGAADATFAAVTVDGKAAADVQPVGITLPADGTVHLVPSVKGGYDIVVRGDGAKGAVVSVNVNGVVKTAEVVGSGVYTVVFDNLLIGHYTVVVTQDFGGSVTTASTMFDVVLAGCGTSGTTTTGTTTAGTTTTGTTTAGTTTAGTTTAGTTTAGTTTAGTTTAGTTTSGTTTAGTTTAGTTTAGTTTQGCPVVPDSADVTFSAVALAGQAAGDVQPVGITLPADGTVHLVPSVKGGYDIVVRGDGAKGAVVSVNVNGVVKTAEVVGSGVYTVVFDNLLIGHYTVVVTQDFGGSVTTASTMFDVVLAGCGTSGTTTTGTTTTGTTTAGTTTAGTTTAGTTTAGTTTAGTTTAGTTTAGTTTAGTTTAGTATAGTTTAGTSTAGTTTAGTTTAGTATTGTTTAGTTTGTGGSFSTGGSFTTGSTGSTGSTGGNGGGGSLASTGLDNLWLIPLALVILASGTALLAARQKRHIAQQK